MIHVHLVVYFQSNHFHEASYGRDQLQSASCKVVHNPMTDQEPEMRCLNPITLEPVSPQQKSNPQRPLQYMPLQELAHGSDQQHSTNKQAPLAALQSNFGCYGARTELGERATVSQANPSNQDEIEIYNDFKYPNSNGEVRIQQPVAQLKGLVDNNDIVSKAFESNSSSNFQFLDFQTSAQQINDNDVEQPLPSKEVGMLERKEVHDLYVIYEVIDLQNAAQETNDTEICNESGQDFTSGMGDTDAQIHIPEVPEIVGTNMEDNILWVKLKKPGEGLKGFLRKNWSEMLRHLPNPRPKNRNRTYVWQEKEPEDPEKLKKWLNVIKQKYWRVMQVLFLKVKIPTTEAEGKTWQQMFIANCEQTH